jgi:DNA ligase (NAD+)
MYSSEQTCSFQTTTKSLLEKVATNAKVKDIEDLRSVLRFHEHRYYILNDPLI